MNLCRGRPADLFSTLAMSCRGSSSSRKGALIAVKVQQTLNYGAGRCTKCW